MTTGIAKAYDVVVLHHPRLVLVALLAILVFFGYYAQDFKLAASADSLLLEDDADLNEFRKIHERYPSGDLLVVTYSPEKDLFSDQALEPLKQLREELKQLPSVETVLTILDAPLLKASDKSFTEVISDIPSLDKPDIDRVRAKDELINSPLFSELIISADGQTTAVLLSLVQDEHYDNLSISRNQLRAERRTAGLSSKQKLTLERVEYEYDRAKEALNAQRHLEIAQIREILERYSEHGVLFLGGVPMITDDMVTFVRNDLTVFGGGVLAFLIIILTAIFRN